MTNDQEQNMQDMLRQVSEHTAEIVIQVVSKSFDIPLEDIRDAIQKELDNGDNKANKSPTPAPKKIILP